MLRFNQTAKEREKSKPDWGGVWWEQSVSKTILGDTGGGRCQSQWGESGKDSFGGGNRRFGNDLDWGLWDLKPGVRRPKRLCPGVPKSRAKKWTKKKPERGWTGPVVHGVGNPMGG